MSQTGKVAAEGIKTYILDSSVLIHDPWAAQAFGEHRVIIPIQTIDELQEVATTPGGRGAGARDALRNLLELYERYSQPSAKLSPKDQADWDADIGVEGEKAKDRLYQFPRVIVLPSGGSVELVNNALAPYQLDGILAFAETMEDGILVTKDTALRLKATAHGLQVEDYRHDKLAGDGARIYSGRSVLFLSAEEMSEILKNADGIPCPESPVYCEAPGRECDIDERGEGYRLSENEFVIVKDISNPSHSILARFAAGRLVRLNYAECHPWDVRPRNVGQTFAIEALMSPARPQGGTCAPLVILKGPAGTAKTFLSVACGLEQTLERDSQYTNILVSRQSSLLDESPGYLPGTEVEKVSPLLRSIFDNLDALMSEGGPHGGQNTVDELMSRGTLQIQAMTFMRGRSIQNTFIIIDEAQNCTAKQLLTLVSRVGEGSKIVLCGDLDQIDNPYLDRYSSGLTFISEKMRGSPLCWQVSFREDECVRSQLAAEAIHRMTT